MLVCSEIEGGAMHTMRFAHELGKPRFAVTAQNDDACWTGNAQAIAGGATPIPFDVDAALKILRG